jgi:hypothetical protein
MFKKTLSISLVVCLALSVCLVSAQPGAPQSGPLTPASELEARGGMDCDTGMGLIVGLAISAATPCWVLCAAGAWYVLGYMAITGCTE